MSEQLTFSHCRKFLGAATATVVTFVVACSGPPPGTEPIRLVDRFADALIEQTPTENRVEYPETLWTFGGDPEMAFSAQAGVDDLRIEDDRLKGTSSSEQPVLVARRNSEVPASEVLHSIEVRARVSAGSELTVRFGKGEQLVLPAVLGNPFGSFTTPLQSGDDLVTYIIRPPRKISPEEIDHVLVTPSDVAGAEFEIESVQLLFRGEHLASIPSGVGWHGMSEIYRETLVTRAPEVVRYTDLVLPADPSLEFAMATNDSEPLTFRVTVTPNRVAGARTVTHEVTTSDTWESTELDLGDLAGERVELTLAVESEQAGTLGFWGAPAIRSRSAKTTDDRSDTATPSGVILLITDTLRSDHLDAYGYERVTAPHLTRMAAEGVRFENAVSQGTWTKVSVTAIQTSLYASTHTVKDVPDRLPASATTIAEVYREAGYATLALTTISFVGRLTNLHQGYETLHEGSSIEDELGPKSAAELVGRLLPWLEQHKDSPFFVLLHVADPHSPYRPKAANETTFAAEGDMDRLDELIEKVRPHITHHPLMKRFGMPRREELEIAGIDAEEFVRHEINGYDGSIRGMDDAIGQLLDGLDRMGLTQRILIGQVSDHGTEFLEHGAHFHGHTLYGELNRVPMILWGPGTVPANRIVSPVVQTIDLMPTLLELSGLTTPAAAQGQTLTPLFAGEGAARWGRPAITEAPLNMRGELMTAIHDEQWKLIRFQAPDGEAPRYELYEHRKDPLNQADLAADHSDTVERLSERLASWQEFALEARLEETIATDQIDAEELKRLRSLGYVQ